MCISCVTLAITPQTTFDIVVINDGVQNKEGVIVVGVLRLVTVCVWSTLDDSILLHLGVRTVCGSQSSTDKIPSPTGQKPEHLKCICWWCLECVHFVDISRGRSLLQVISNKYFLRLIMLALTLNLI